MFEFLHTHLLQFNIPLFTLSPPLSLSLPFSSSSSSICSPAGLSVTNVLLYSFGFIFSVVVFPIGVVLWILSYCGVFNEDSDDSSHTSYSSPHNSTSECMPYSVFLYLELVFFIVTNYKYPTDHRPFILYIYGTHQKKFHTVALNRGNAVRQSKKMVERRYNTASRSLHASNRANLFMYMGLVFSSGVLIC